MAAILTILGKPLTFSGSPLKSGLKFGQLVILIVSPSKYLSQFVKRQIKFITTGNLRYTF